jgi:CMP-N-acetylneuraminic acid synthetase
VSTDSEYYAEISKQYGAEIPFLRPEEFSRDDSTDLDVFIHALNFLKINESKLPDICVHLRPTHPIRSTEDIDNMITILLENNDIDSVRSLSLAAETPYKMWTLTDNGTIKPVIGCDIKEAYNMPRQKLPAVYMQNASIDVIRSSTILSKKSMTGDNIHGYIMEDCYDIDTPEQFEKASRAILAEKESLINKTFCFDIDGVIASLTPDNDYSKARPLLYNIELINKLYNLGNTIYLNTARGFVTGIDWREITENQLKKWKVSHHKLLFGKPAADYYIDDRMISIEDIKKILKKGQINDTIV